MQVRPATSQNEEVSMPAGGKHKIVIVEDEGLIAADLEIRLKSAGYDVPGTADSAERALEVIRKTSPDLVLMDIHLKGSIDGIEVAAQVRKELDVPVVYLTAFEDRGTLERAGRTEAFGYIKKPIASASLRGSIELAIAKHRQERSLRAQMEWASASFHSVPYAVLVTDGQGRITYLNSQAEQLTGWTASQALGSPCTELLRFRYFQNGAAVGDYLPVVMLHGEVVVLPDGICLKRDDSQTYAIEGSIAPRWRNGRVEGTVIALTDVTSSRFERQHALEDEKQRALQRLAEGIVHHLPNMNPAAEDSPSLLEILNPDSPLRREVETLERAAVDSYRVGSRLRAFLQPLDVHPERIDVGDILRHLESALGMIELRLTVDTNGDPYAAQADPWQLTRALIIILMHAKKKLRKGGMIAIEVLNAPQGLNGPAGIRIAYATDEEAASMARIFEPDWSNSSEDLHTAYRLVKTMGGLLAARMERGDQAIFEVYLPRVKTAVAGAPLPRLIAPATLFVDANAEVRHLLETQFDRHGLKLLTTASWEEGLILAELYPGSIALAIANLPINDENRDLFAQRLATCRPGINVRLLSGYLQPCRAAAGQMLEPGEERHLTKWDLLDWARQTRLTDSVSGARDVRPVCPASGGRQPP
jgi:AmiR/NasT family two-component response regulator